MNTTVYTNDQASAFLTGLFGAAAGMIVILSFIFGIILYIFVAWSYYQMAKNKGLENAWIAWIPIAQLYLIGMIIDKKVYFGTNKVDNAQIYLPIGAILVPALSFIPFIGYLYGIAYAIYVFAALYRVYRLYATYNNSILFLILSIILPVTEPFFLFAIRNKNAVEYKINI